MKNNNPKLYSSKKHIYCMNVCMYVSHYYPVRFGLYTEIQQMKPRIKISMGIGQQINCTQKTYIGFICTYVSVYIDFDRWQSTRFI